MWALVSATNVELDDALFMCALDLNVSGGLNRFSIVNYDGEFLSLKCGWRAVRHPNDN